MKDMPVLWIWDNVEPVDGFPEGNDSEWNEVERRELVDFLREGSETEAKFLLTSRREERRWLGDLPAVVRLLPMPLRDRAELAQAVAAKRGVRFTHLPALLPLLEFTEGNPLTLLVAVSMAVREGISDKDQIASFVARLRAGEEEFDDEVTEARHRSLGASLRYGFEHAFNETERKQLALLHLFRSFVNESMLRLMGDPAFDWSVPEVRGLDQKTCLALLNRATEIGLLSPTGLLNYAIHPALPWFFRTMFETYHAASSAIYLRAFVESVGRWAAFCANEYNRGNTHLAAVLRDAESCLLHAHGVAHVHAWPDAEAMLTSGLSILYDHAGRTLDWERLLERTIPDFLEHETRQALPGTEGYWSFFMGQLAACAKRKRQWAEAEQLLRQCVESNRRVAGPALAPKQANTPSLHGRIRRVIVSAYWPRLRRSAA